MKKDQGSVLTIEKTNCKYYEQLLHKNHKAFTFKA